MRKLIAPILFLAACGGGEGADPSTVQARLKSDLTNVVHETQAASDGSTASLPSGTTLDFLSSALGGITGSSDSSAVRSLRSLRFLPSDPTSEDTVDFDELIDSLNKSLFTSANYQGDGIYTVPASMVCGEDETGAVDADCAANLAKADLRIHVTEDGDNLKFALQVDANHDEPLSIELGHTTLAVTVSLDDASRAVQALAPVFGEDAPDATLSGQVTASLEILGAAHVKAGLTIDRDIAVAIQSDADEIDFTSKATDLVEVELDGDAGVASASLDLGETTAHVPDTTVDSSGNEIDGAIDVVLGGASATVAIDANGLSVTNVGLGDKTTTIKKNGALAASIDVNPDDGRRFDVSLAPSGTDNETLAFSPKLDVRLFQDHAVLGDAPPAFDVSQLLVTGHLTGNASGVQVVDGELKIVTNPASFGVDANAGECVAGDDFGGYTVTTCQ